MAKLILQGDIAAVELTKDDEDGQVIATCVQHFASSWECTWSERYDDMNDATEYAADHADTGRQK
jgi:hypothetical protein